MVIKQLAALRKKIDDVDSRILDLFNERTEVVLRIRETKKDRQLAPYSPAREREILERLTHRNKGPFPNDVLKAVYREILSASLSLQEPLGISYLGPAGTFTHLAAKRQFGPSANYLPESNIRAVFESVARGNARYGVVPSENSTEGVVNYTLDMFIDSELKIASEIVLQVSHNLLSKTGKKSDIKKIYSYPQATAQCRNWLNGNFPGVPIVEELSTAAAAKRVAKDRFAAAVASELAAQVYELKFVKKGIEDFRENYTRFLVIGKDWSPKSGKDKTSILFSIKDEPGALYRILRYFSRYKINLSRIESRPSRRKAWEYIFFVDMEAHIDDREVKKAIRDVKRQCLFLKVLGSYPSA